MQEILNLVPTLVLGTLSFPVDRSIAVASEMVLQTQDGFYTRGSVLLGDDEVIDRFVKNAGLSNLGASITDEYFYNIASRKPGDADLLITHQRNENKKNEEAESEKHAEIQLAAQDALSRFAGQTGLKFQLHFRRKPVCNLFTDEDKDTFHIIVGASPPGAVTTMERQNICGVRLHPKGYWVRSNGPTRGRGQVFKDELQQEVGQIVDRNIYLFAPAISRETAALFSSEGGDLLRKMLQLASKVLAEGVASATEIPIQSPEAFQQYAKERLELDLGFVQELVDEADEKAKQALADYHDALNAKRSYLGTREYHEQLLLGAIETHAASDWTRLSKHPLVKELAIVDDALHVKTRRIIAEESGLRYDFGEFTIRLRLGGNVSVWSMAPTHPRGIAHPHISGSSSFCFGNAGIEIGKAATEMRFADAIELVIEWLASGYDETLAEVKIEEWPVVKEET